MHVTRHCAEPLHTTEHAPLQVIVHVPLLQLTFAPAPTLWVHAVPLQATLQPAPHEPLHEALDSHVKRQPSVVPLQVSKLQVWPEGQSQAVPEHTDPHDEATSIRNSDRAASVRMDESSE